MVLTCDMDTMCTVGDLFFFNPKNDLKVTHSDFQGALLLFRAGPHIFSAYKIVLNLSLF